MEVQKDFKELLELFNAHKVKYLIVGGYALAYHGAPRYTGDIDIFVRADKENALCILDIVGNKDSMPYRFRAFFPMLRNPECDSEIMQSAGDFRDRVAEPFFRVSEHIFDDTETLHA